MTVEIEFLSYRKIRISVTGRVIPDTEPRGRCSSLGAVGRT
jgi:hypothetical protein